jgi:hypothetical protein
MPSVQLASMSDLLGALSHARTVELASYILGFGPLVAALAAAGDRGATVTVRLEPAPMDDAHGDLTKRNAAVAAALRAHGVRVELSDRAATHLKAAVVDGCAFLDDRNWPLSGPNTLVRDDDGDDVAVVRDAIRGETSSDAHLWTRKYDALRAEASLIRDPSADHIAVSSESFGPGIIARELQDKAEAGCDVRLLVCKREASNPREAAALRRLADAGVHIRTTGSSEKMAVAGSQAWLGSANATMFPFDQADWGLRTRTPSLVATLQEKFDATWETAKPFPQRANNARAFASVSADTSSSGTPSNVASALAVSTT